MRPWGPTCFTVAVTVTNVRQSASPQTLKVRWLPNVTVVAARPGFRPVDAWSRGPRDSIRPRARSIAWNLAAGDCTLAAPVATRFACANAAMEAVRLVA